MDWAKVDTVHGGIGEGVAEIKSPDSGTGSGIEYPAGGGADRGGAEGSAEEDKLEMVVEVQAGLFGFVVGRDVFAVRVGVVAAPVFVYVGSDRGGEGLGFGTVAMAGGGLVEIVEMRERGWTKPSRNR